MEAFTEANMKYMTLIGWLTLVAQSALAAGPEVSVSLEPKQFALGEAGQSKGIFSSALGKQGTLPEMEGLESVRTRGSSQNASTNSEVRESQSLVHLAAAIRVRTSTIPDRDMGSGHDAGSSRPVALQVTGSGSTPDPNISHSVTRETSSVETELAPNRVEPGEFVSTLRPLYLLPWFLTVNFVALAGLAAASFSFRRRIRLVRTPNLLWASLAGRASRADLATMADAIRRAEAGDFFAAARGALQQRLAKRWRIPAEIITLAEIKARTNGDAGDLRRIFEMADQLAYRSGRLSSVDLMYWQIIVRKELERWK
jgi:hypothetical protein